jgi:hypothetical protein
MKQRYRLIYLPIALSLWLMCASCSRQPSAENRNTADDSWAQTRDAIVEEYLKAHPVFGVIQGRHEYDGILPDWSAGGIAAEIGRLRGWRDRVMKFGQDALTDNDRFERDYLAARFERDLYWLETAEAPFVNPAWYLDWMVDNIDPAPYITRNYAPPDTRIKAYTKYARGMMQAAAQIQSNLRTPMSRPLLERGVTAYRGLADFYTSDVPKAFAEVKDPAIQKDFVEANAAAAKAMRELASWLESQRGAATASYALGADRFAKMLRDTERVDTPLPQLEAAGRADLERNQQALREACAAFAPKMPISGCIAKMNDNKAPGSAVEAARMQLVSLKKFVGDAGFATIPGTDEALVAESPPYNRANFAYIDIPGPYEKGQPATYYIAPPDPSWSAKEQRDYLPGRADLLFTSVHEVWPFLQYLHSNRNPSLVGRLFVGYAFSEGWAHYAEEASWEMGLGSGDPETHIGQLTNALMRNVRFLSAIGLHTHGMTVEDSEKMFREQAYADAGTARQQAARGTYDPAYLNYTLGKLMIRKLREDWTASRGGQAVWRAFHNQFLGYGGPPIPMVRQRMLGNAESLF